FKGILSVYVGDKVPEGNTFIRIEPISSTLISSDSIMETRRYSVDIWYYFVDKNVKSTTITHVLRFVSRIEALLHDNMNNTYFNGRTETTEINKTGDGYAIRFNYACSYAGNTG
ncbi:MAG: hypothetical protein ACE5D7_11230, partial [Fidelibacterota bacterium]